MQSNSMIKCELYKLMVSIQSGDVGRYGTMIVSHGSFQLYMFDPDLYKIYENLPEKCLDMGSDASGSVVKDVRHTSNLPCDNIHGEKRTLIHANVVSIEGHTILSGAMLSNSQDAIAMTNFQTFHIQQIMMRNKKSPFKRVIVDWSHAGILSILRAYNGMSPTQYMNAMYGHIIRQEVLPDNPTSVFLIICYSHFMKIISGFANRQITAAKGAYTENNFQKNQKRLLMSLFAMIRGSDDIKYIEMLFKTMVQIFG